MLKKAAPVTAPATPATEYGAVPPVMSKATVNWVAAALQSFFRLMAIGGAVKLTATVSASVQPFWSIFHSNKKFPLPETVAELAAAPVFVKFTVAPGGFETTDQRPVPSWFAEKPTLFPHKI